MNVATIEQARELARNLERRERSRVGTLDAARAVLARRAGIAPSTWRNLALGRLKRLDVWMRYRLQSLVVRELESEITRLTHDLDVARQIGASLDSEQVSEIQAYLHKARSLLEGGRE